MTPTHEIKYPQWEHIHERDDKIERLEAALREAMDVRHFCDMEGSGPETDPYDYDTYLRRWAEALGERVESTWPVAGLKAAEAEAENDD